MTTNDASAPPPKHLTISQPSPWVARWAHLVKPGGTVLDVASGGGRHGRLFLAQGHAVTFVDKNVTPLDDLTQATVIEANLEDASPWPFTGQTFDAVVVVNYLHRELFQQLIESLAPGGVLIYETFALGNEAFCRPRNPDHLLKSGELLTMASTQLQVVAYEHGIVQAGDIPGVKQRLCAVNDLKMTKRVDGEPSPHEI